MKFIPTLPPKDAERIARGQLVKTMRTLMGVKQGAIAKDIGMLQSNLSKIERGKEIISDSRLKIIQNMFIAWREQEVKHLQERIDYLNNLF